MANSEHLKILKQGVNAWNQWRLENPEMIPDLEGAGLRGAHLSGADLRWADLFGAELTEVNLRRANLGGAHLRMANLRKADLFGANLRGADLREANLDGADLGEVEFIRADLSGASLVDSDFTNAFVGLTVFGDNDLSTVKWLERVRHRGPSIIGIDTIYKSKGNIPEVFLRGCGVPEDFIVYMRSLVGKAIEFYSCFISYSSKDDD